jgi:hypothetical protein
MESEQNGKFSEIELTCEMPLPLMKLQWGAHINENFPC